MTVEAATTESAAVPVLPAFPKKTAPLLTIVTVVLNSARSLEQALESVLSQDYPNVEYIVIDGGSTDGTLDIIRRHEARIDCWTSGPDGGIYDAMNRGLAKARGAFVGFLGADDYYEPGALAAVARAMIDVPGADIVYGHRWIVRDDLGVKYRSFADHDYRRGMSIGHQAMFVRRDLLLRRGGFDTRYGIAADFDFLVEALTAGVCVVATGAFLVNYRDSGISAREMCRSMSESRCILARRRGIFSCDHLLYLLRFLKSLALTKIDRLLSGIAGERLAARFRRWYLFAFIARERVTL